MCSSVRGFLSFSRREPPFHQKSEVIQELQAEISKNCRRCNKITVEGADPKEPGKTEYAINIMEDTQLIYRFYFTDHTVYICRFNNNVLKLPRRKMRVKDTRKEAKALFEYFMKNNDFKRIEIGTPEFSEVGLLYVNPPIQFLRVPDWKTGKKLAIYFQPVELAIGALPRINARRLDDSDLDLSKLKRIEYLSIGSDTKIKFEQFYKYDLRKLELISYEKNIKMKHALKLKELFETGKTTLEELIVVNFKDIVETGDGKLLLKQEVFGAFNGEIAHLVAHEKVLRLYQGQEIEGEQLFEKID